MFLEQRNTMKWMFAVSKTVGRGFEPCCPCQNHNTSRQNSLPKRGANAIGHIARAKGVRVHLAAACADLFWRILRVDRGKWQVALASWAHLPPMQIQDCFVRPSISVPLGSRGFRMIFPLECSCLPVLSTSLLHV